MSPRCLAEPFHVASPGILHGKQEAPDLQESDFSAAGTRLHLFLGHAAELMA